MSRSPGDLHRMQHGEVRGVDARTETRDAESLDTIRTETKARINRQSIQFFLLVLAAVAAAIAAVVAVIGADRLV